MKHLLKGFLMAAIVATVSMGYASEEETRVVGKKSAREEQRYVNEGVERLDLSRNWKLKDVSFLLSFPNLTELNLSKCSQVGDNCTVISKLIHLTHLDVSEVNIDQLEWIRPLTSLKRLNLDGNWHLTQIEPITHLPLEHLEMALCCQVQDAALIGKIPTLKFLQMARIFADIHLEEDIRGERPEISLTFLEKLKNLEELHIPSNEFLLSEHILPIGKLESLTYIDLSNCFYIDNLNVLEKCKNIKILNIKGLFQTIIPKLENVKIIS